MPRKRAQRTIHDSPSSESDKSGRPSPELGSPSDDIRLPAVLQSLREVHIALDTGTERTKASVILQYADKKVRTPTALIPTTVIWPNCTSSVLTQVAVGGLRRMLWGDEVDQELKKGDIVESQVVRGLKPALIETHKVTQRALHRDLRLPEHRKIELIDALNLCGEDADDYQLENVSAFSDYMGFAYRYVLQFIAKAHGSLGWPVLVDLEGYRNWSPPGKVKIRVSLPVPVGSTPEQVQLIVATAKAAGIPNPYPVAEPASALIHHLYKARNQSINGKTFLILDIGAGSADQQVWTVVNENPLQVREHIIPEHVKTAWCGGAYINKEAVRLIMNDIWDIDGVINALQRSGSAINDRDSLERKLTKKFEKEKLRFEGWETLYLRITGLPDIPEFRLCGGGKVTLEANDVKRAFAPCLNGVVSMLDTAIESVSKMGEQRVHEIIVVGGCSQNRYLLDQIRKRYSGGLQSPFPYLIPVTLPPDAATGSMTVAKGAVLLSAERELVEKRYVRRSFCVRQFEEVNIHLYPPESVYKSPQDGRKRVPVTRFLLTRGLHAQRFSSEPLLGWIGLVDAEMEDDDTWLVEEHLYYSDTLTQDRLWIEDPFIDIHKMPTPLTFRISLDEAQRFPRKKSPSKKTWYHFNYELILTLDGDIMTFKFTIPRAGKWPTRGDRYADVMYRTGQYDTAGVSQLFSSA